MKYSLDLYTDSGFYSDDSAEVENHKEKVVKCRKPHKCCGCSLEISAGDYALLETGFFDGKPVSCHTCISCIEKWLEESGQVDRESEGINNE